MTSEEANKLASKITEKIVHLIDEKIPLSKGDPDDSMAGMYGWQLEQDLIKLLAEALMGRRSEDEC